MVVQWVPSCLGLAGMRAGRRGRGLFCVYLWYIKVMMVSPGVTITRSVPILAFPGAHCVLDLGGVVRVKHLLPRPSHFTSHVFEALASLIGLDVE